MSKALATNNRYRATEWVTRTVYNGKNKVFTDNAKRSYKVGRDGKPIVDTLKTTKKPRHIFDQNLFEEMKQVALLEQENEDED